MPLKLFLSHASPDKPFVQTVKDFLEQGRDIECWLDRFEIGFGQNIVSRINDGLAKSDFVLLFLSRASMPTAQNRIAPHQVRKHPTHSDHPTASLPHFIGRESELAQLKHRLSQGL